MRTTDVGATETTNGILYARSGIHHARPSHNVSATTKNGTILLTTPTVDGTANTSGLPAKKMETKKRQRQQLPRKKEAAILGTETQHTISKSVGYQQYTRVCWN